MKKLTNWLKGPTALAALAGVAAAAVVLSVAELIGAFFTARATPLIALGSTFIDFTPPWLKDFAIATFGTNDKAALFAGMGLTILLLACVLGVVAYRKWALGVAGVLLMGAVIVASVVTRASVKPLDAIPSLIGTAAGLVVLRLLMTRLWRMSSWPGCGRRRGSQGHRTSGHNAPCLLRRVRDYCCGGGHRGHRGPLAQRGSQQRGPGP